MSSRPQCPHCGKYANLTGCFGECVERNKQAEDREGVKEVFDLMRNRPYVQTYGISTTAVETCQNTLEVLKKHFGRVVTKPLQGDRVIVTATGRVDGSEKTYSNALITNVFEDGEIVICMQPYAPFLNGVMGEHKHNETGLKMSVSGGYFGGTNASKLKLTEPQNAWYCFFADGARAGGAVYIECKAVTWTVTTDEFY